MAFETEGSKIIYQGRVFDVRQDQVRMPDGKLVRFDVVAHHGAVTILPVDDEGQVWFVRQYRHPAKTVLLELPAGVMEEGEAPEVSAGGKFGKRSVWRLENCVASARFTWRPVIRPSLCTFFWPLTLLRRL